MISETGENVPAVTEMLYDLAGAPMWEIAFIHGWDTEGCFWLVANAEGIECKITWRDNRWLVI